MNMDLKSQPLVFRYGLFKPGNEVTSPIITPAPTCKAPPPYTHRLYNTINTYHIFKTEYLTGAGNWFIFSTHDQFKDVKDFLYHTLVNSSHYKLADPIFMQNAHWGNNNYNYWFDLDNNYAIILGLANAERYLQRIRYMASNNLLTKDLK